MTESQVDTAGADAAALVTAARAGDEAALAELVRTHLPLVYNVIGRALNGHADVDDLVQETMILAMRGLPGLREPDRFRSWLAAIAYRQVQQYQRRSQRSRLRRQEVPAELADPGSDFADRTVTELMLTGQRRELAEAARWLDDADRRLLALWWQEAAGELTRAELAAAIRLDPSHAKVRVQRMKERLDAARGVVRALRASPRCTELAALARDWSGRVEPLWRKRLTRHVRDCPRCRAYRGGLIPPENLLLGLGLLPVAAGVGVALRAGGSAWPAVTHKVTALAAAAVVLTGGGFVYAVYRSPADPPPSGSAAEAAISRLTLPRPVSVGGTGGVSVADIYVAPGGTDTGPGTIAHPYATLARAVAVVRPGQTIALRGGTYRPTAGTVIATSGTAARRIVLSNYRDERPVIDATAIPAEQWTVSQRAGFWTVQGLEIKNSRSHAYVCQGCRHDIFRRLSIHDNVRSSLALWGNGTVDNQVLDSDFYGNCDPRDGGRSGVGLEVKFGSGGGNLVWGNRAFANADNGFDLGSFASPVTLEHNWAYGNGFNRWRLTDWHSNADGFHLGGGQPIPAAAHVLLDNAAWGNVNNGFAGNDNRGALRLARNTAYRNGGAGFALPGAAATLLRNLAVDNGSPVGFGAGSQVDGNTWAGTVASFRSTDPALAQGPRAPDGTLPRGDFLAATTAAGATMAELS